MKMINAGGKDEDAQKFVDNLKDRFVVPRANSFVPVFCCSTKKIMFWLLLCTTRSGNGITTKCLIYNATGTTLNYDTYHDWHGHIYETPYPEEIQNGQWGAYIHVHPSGSMVGSAGAVVYRSKLPSDENESCDWLFAWSIPFLGGSNRVTKHHYMHACMHALIIIFNSTT